MAWNGNLGGGGRCRTFDRIAGGADHGLARFRSGDLGRRAILLGANGGRLVICEPVHIDDLIVGAAIDLRRFDGRRKSNRCVGGGIRYVITGWAGDDRVVFLVAAGKRSGGNEHDEHGGASHASPFALKRPSVKVVILHIVELGHSFVETMPYQAGSSAQRIRIGLTGLAFAFLLVLLGSIISHSSRDETANAVTQAVVNEPNEPLAELGVAPGAADATNNSSSGRK